MLEVFLLIILFFTAPIWLPALLGLLVLLWRLCVYLTALGLIIYLTG